MTPERRKQYEALGFTVPKEGNLVFGTFLNRAPSPKRKDDEPRTVCKPDVGSPAYFHKWYKEWKSLESTYREYEEIDGHRMIEDAEPGETRYFMYDNECEEVPVRVIGTYENFPIIQVLRGNKKWDDGSYILSKRFPGIREVTRKEIAHLLPTE